MGFWAVIFVVLMILVLVGGAFGYKQPGAPWVYGGFLLWCCVAILGAIVLGGLPAR